MEPTPLQHTDVHWMTEAVQLAYLGEGRVEPNPLVGCVIIEPSDGFGRIVGKGFHERFGEPHAEVNALLDAGKKAKGATVYVTLEPCSHLGKTPPCADALIEAQVGRVVIGCLDPFELVDGRGAARLIEAGIQVTSGVGGPDVFEVIRPFAKCIKQKRPWVIGKWAMSLDGKIATVTGESQWISNEASRIVVHQIRGRVDAIMIGSGTAERDDPLLTARPNRLRTATRVVLDTAAKIRADSKLISTVAEAPVMIVVGPGADPGRCEMLRIAGCEVWQGCSHDPNERLVELLSEMARRGMTNVLVEGGGQLLGALSQLGELDEIHAFIAPKILGGKGALSPIGGEGFPQIINAAQFKTRSVHEIEGDIHVIARLAT